MDRKIKKALNMIKSSYNEKVDTYIKAELKNMMKWHEEEADKLQNDPNIELSHEDIIDIHRAVLARVVSIIEGAACLTVTGSLTAKAEVIKGVKEQLDAVKQIVTNNGLSDIFLNLSFINKDIGIKQDLLSYVHETKKGNRMIVKGKEGQKSAGQVISSSKAAIPVLLFLLFKLPIKRTRLFEFDLNEYFTFYGIERQTRNIETLEKGLEFLSHLYVHYTAKYKGKEITARGDFLAFNIIREGKGNRESVSIALMDWANPVIENLDQYMLIDGDILAVVDQRKYPKIIPITYKLYDRFRTNLHRRKGRREVISVRGLISDGLGITDKQLKKRGYEEYLISLERHLNHLKDLGFINWHYENKNEHITNKDCYNDNIIYKVENEIINEKYKEVSKGRGKKIGKRNKTMKGVG